MRILQRCEAIWSRFEGADAMPCHCVGAREGVRGGRYFGGCGLEESLVPALVFQCETVRCSPFTGKPSPVDSEKPHCQNLLLFVSEDADPVPRGPHVSVARAALAVSPSTMGGGVACAAARA